MYKWFFDNVKQTTNHRAWKLLLVLWYPMGFIHQPFSDGWRKRWLVLKLKKKGNYKLEKLESWKVGKFTCDGKVYSFYICKSWCLSSVWYPPQSSLLQDCVKYITHKIYHKGSKSPCWTDIHLVQNSIRVPSLPYASSCFFAMLHCVSLNNYFKKSPPPPPLSLVLATLPVLITSPS